MQKKEIIFIRILGINTILSILSIIVLSNIMPMTNEIKEIPETNILEVSSNKTDESIQEKVPVSQTIYWALQDNDKDDVNETLVLSNISINGNESGNFSGDKKFTNGYDVPWVKVKNYDSTSNLSLNVTTVKIEGIVAPSSTSYWFSGVGINSKTFNADLSNLNVSNVIDMSYMFDYTAQGATSFIIKGLANWNISNVRNMSYMFYHAGQSATTFLLDGISHWNTSNDINKSYIFSYSGYNKRN